MITLVDTCIWLDVFGSDPHWASWSQAQVDLAIQRGGIAINPVVYAELSVGFERIGLLDDALGKVSARFADLPREALFLAGKAYRQYRSRRGIRASVLPDFFIGAHAAICGWPVLTRDTARFSTYFPTVTLLTPATS